MEVQAGSNPQRLSKLLLSSMLLAGLIVLGNLAIILLVTNEAQKLVFINVTYPLWDLWAVLGLGYAAWSSARQSRRLALAWGCLAAAAFCTGIGNSIWAVIELSQGEIPFPSLADALYLFSYPLFLGGVLFFPARRLQWQERLKMMIDMIMVMLTATLLFWRYVLDPIVASTTEGSLLGQLVALAYPVGDLVLLWEEGENSGLYALGTLVGDVYDGDPLEEGGAPAKWIRWRLDATLTPPPAKAELKDHDVLKGLKHFDRKDATNLPVDQAQWHALRSMLQDEPQVDSSIPA